MKKFFHDNGLTLVLLMLFSVSLGLQFAMGLSTYNHEREHQNLPPLTAQNYWSSGHFISSVGENMESEFLQMALFVFLTAFLYQKGSSESNKLPSEKTPKDLQEDAREEEYSRAQKRIHPVTWRIYENSLTLILMGLFLLAFFFHAYGSMKAENVKRLHEHGPSLAFWEIFAQSEFWFQSFQNWQSEFFSIAIMVLLSIRFRQKNSSQSKKLFAPDDKTGCD